MGTRGICGFVVNGQARYHYNHFDSYPSGLGVDVLGFVRSMLADGKEETVKARAAALRSVKEDGKPTPEDVAAVSKYTDLGVSRQSPDDWYCLLHDCQGDLGKVLDSGYILQADGFPADSLFCEWGYLVNLDDRTIEVFRGFCERPHRKGRFAALPTANPAYRTDKYYPIRLVRTFHFEDLPSDAAFKRSLGRF